MLSSGLGSSEGLWPAREAEWRWPLSVRNRDPAHVPSLVPCRLAGLRTGRQRALQNKPPCLGHRTEHLSRHKSAFPVKRASLAGKTLPWPLVVTYLSRHALSGRASEHRNIRYEIAQEPGSLYFGIFCWGGFWPSKGQKGNVFCWLCIVVSVKPINIWVSSGIASMQKSIVRLPKTLRFIEVALLVVITLY